MPVAYLWGKAFNIPLSTLQSATSMLSSCSSRYLPVPSRPSIHLGTLTFGLE